MNFSVLIKLIISASVLAVGAIAAHASTSGRDTINVVGSSTVYPFTTVVAERFGKSSRFKTPRVEATGTGSGIKLFCSGLGVSTPDLSNASRRMKKSEFDRCRANGVTKITEVMIGFDGIVLANTIETEKVSFQLRDIYLALAKKIPVEGRPGVLIENPFTTWREVNPGLPDYAIEVLGPAPTSGTRDAFSELVMEGGCSQTPWIAALKEKDPVKFKVICHSVREDGKYIEVGENDNLIVHKLINNPQALGIFGYSFLDQNSDRIQGADINGITPEFTSIANGSYVVSRPLYFYVKVGHEGKIPGIKAFLTEFTSESAMGYDGYLSDKGLIPLPKAMLEVVREDVLSLKPMQL